MNKLAKVSTYYLLLASTTMMADQKNQLMVQAFLPQTASISVWDDDMLPSVPGGDEEFVQLGAQTSTSSGLAIQSQLSTSQKEMQRIEAQLDANEGHQTIDQLRVEFAHSLVQANKET